MTERFTLMRGTYTHCRGCGRELLSDDDQTDGLCLWVSQTGIAEVPNNCTTKASEWWREQGRGSTPWFDTIEWSVAIDEWIEATK